MTTVISGSVKRAFWCIVAVLVVMAAAMTAAWYIQKGGEECPVCHGKQLTCQHCVGSGRVKEPGKCRKCNGSGKRYMFLKCRQCNGTGDAKTTQKCGSCGGSGKTKCPKCGK